MRALGLLLAAVVLVACACASPRARVDVPPATHHGGAAMSGSGRDGLHRYANRAHCWFLRDDPPAAGAGRHASGNRASGTSGSPAPQPAPTGGPPRDTPSPPAPSVALPTSAN